MTMENTSRKMHNRSIQIHLIYIKGRVKANPSVVDKKTRKEAERVKSDLHSTSQFHLSRQPKRVPCKDRSVKALQTLLAKGLNVWQNKVLPLSLQDKWIPTTRFVILHWALCFYSQHEIPGWCNVKQINQSQH